MHAIRLLLVEDDATSAAFLAEALAALPAQVEVAGSIAQALDAAGAAPHALWLVDAHLPDGDGIECLAALRRATASPPLALAITAGATREEVDALCAGGFLEVLPKPVSVALLQGTVRRLLGIGDVALAAASPAAPQGKLPVWERERALAAIGGNPDALAKLRALFLAELPGQHAQLREAQRLGDAAAVAALVHKLRASCGFVGAARLAQAVASLAAAPLDPARLRGFELAAGDTLSADAQS